jgi:glycosyltransferase involved in cell wall biosynthesis
MRLAQLHCNHVVRGGSDIMFARTVAILKDHGHEVFTVERDNRLIKGFRKKVEAALAGIFSLSARNTIEHVARFAPDVAHIHNLYPSLSASVFGACISHHIPMVMRLADYSLICPSAHHVRRERLCDKCCGGRVHHCVIHNCKGAPLVSIDYAIRSVVTVHLAKRAGRWLTFIAPSEFVRRRFIAEGYSAESIVVVPNPVPIPSRLAQPSKGRYIAYAGRLSPEKGVRVLLQAAEATGLPLRVAGEGQELARLQSRGAKNVQFLGALGEEGIKKLFLGARFVVVPSIAMETFGLSCSEAMAAGVPVIASEVGALPDLVRHYETGILVPPLDASSLQQAMRELWESPHLADTMGKAARSLISSNYTYTHYHDRLLSAYTSAIARSRA